MAKKRSKFLRKDARSVTELSCLCYADPQLFVPAEKLSKAALAEFRVNGPIPCEGGGVPGEWCGNCRFGKIMREEGF